MCNLSLCSCAGEGKGEVGDHSVSTTLISPCCTVCWQHGVGRDCWRATRGEKTCVAFTQDYSSEGRRQHMGQHTGGRVTHDSGVHKCFPRLIWLLLVSQVHIKRTHKKCLHIIRTSQQMDAQKMSTIRTSLA